ncbi:MAG: SDR family oxidoreductase, partial [Kutzneria sp.]|nr:SDR family oxidoreductase [Kutzneria sp.]
MRMVVLGPTGRIGTQVVRRALADGHQVVAVARRPETVAISHENVTVVTGDVLEPESLREPFTGANVIVFAVGNRGRGPTILR